LVDRQPGQDPLTAPASCLRARFGRLQLGLEHLTETLGPFADEPWHPHPQPRGMTGHGNVSQLPDDVVAQAPLGATPRAEPEYLDRPGLDDGHITGPDLRAGDRQPELERAADDISNGAASRAAAGRFHR